MRPGRKPNERGWKSASKIDPRTSSTAICTTRSFTVGMPSGRWPPLPLGIRTRRTGSGRYVLAFNSRCTASSQRACVSGVATIVDRLSPSTPGAPPLRVTNRSAAGLAVSVLHTGSRTGIPVRPWPCATASLGGAGAFVGLLSLSSHLPLLPSATTPANKQRPFAPLSTNCASPGSEPKGPAVRFRCYYERLRLRDRPPPPHRTNRLARRIERGVGLRSSVPLSPLYPWLSFPTCLPRRPRRR